MCDFQSLLSVELLRVANLICQFQGGFAARACQIKTKETLHSTFYPTDSNSVQEFDVDFVENEATLHFSGFTDFYGRLIVYTLEFHDS